MPTAATLIDTDRAVKPGVRGQRADGRQPTRSQVLIRPANVIASRSRRKRCNDLTLIRAAFRASLTARPAQRADILVSRRLFRAVTTRRSPARMP